MVDKKYLYCRNQIYYVRFSLPKRYGSGYFLKSLKTSNLPQARIPRDLVVMLFLAKQGMVEAVDALLQISGTIKSDLD